MRVQRIWHMAIKDLLRSDPVAPGAHDRSGWKRRKPGCGSHAAATRPYHVGMSDSLRDQLLKAGLVSRKQATKAEQQQHRQQYRDAKGGSPAATAGRGPAAAAAQAAKAARDRGLNEARQAKVAARARAGEIRQLLDQNRLPVLTGDQLEYFNFVAGRKIRRIALDKERRERLRRGELCIVWHEGRTGLVPADVAARIRERDARAVIAFDDAPPVVDENDPYKDFVVPDDLTW